MAGKTKTIDEALLYDLAKIHCTLPEMADILHVSKDHLLKKYNDIIKKAQSEGRSSLRRAQWVKAMEGSVPMLIWLGKHLLGQKDSVELITNQPEVQKLIEYWETAKIQAYSDIKDQRAEWKKRKTEAAKREIEAMAAMVGEVTGQEIEVVEVEQEEKSPVSRAKKK